MASSVTEITSTKDIATCGAIALSGPTKIIAGGLSSGEYFSIYEETATEGEYQRVPETNGRTVVIEFSMPSIIFEGYGNHKILRSANTDDAKKIGYVA